MGIRNLKDVKIKETKKGSFKEELVNRYIEFIVEKCNMGRQLPGRTFPRA